MSKIKYFKNFILCGDLDYRCLLCKENCYRKDFVERHLRWEKHRKALKTQSSMPQFGMDSIYKLDPYYYCSICNQTMQDIAEIKQHIDSDIHKDHKTHPVSATTRVEVKVIADDIFIENTPVSQFQWHSIIDGQCVLCNVAVNNLSSHVSNQEHMVKLIQARVSCVNDKYYRKIDKRTFQCFTCEKTFPIPLLDNHFMNHNNNNSIEGPKTDNGNVQHMKQTPNIKIYKDGNELKDCTMAETNGEYPTVLCGTGMDKIRKTEWDFQMIAGLKDDYFEIDMEAKKITCKICKANNIKVAAADIAKHLFSHRQYSTNACSIYKTIDKHIQKNYIQRDFDHGAARSKTAKYGRENFIKMNAGGGKGYCTLCDKFLSASIDVFKGHTAGRFHTGHLELKGLEKPRKHERGSYKPVFIMELIKTLSHSADKKAFLINGYLLMNEDSFFLLKRIEHGKYYKKTKCFACDETILPEEEKEHCITWKHKSKLLAAKTISEDRLVIREIRPRLYHCGVCNEALPYWETLINHTKHLNHQIKYKETVPVLGKRFGFSKSIVLKTNNDNLYMQLLNAVFDTKYVIKIED